jgi:hypothetical protein
MSKLDDCKHDISKMYRILMETIITYDYCFYFHEPETRKEKLFLDGNRHMRWIRHEMYRLTVIDLAKLVTDAPATHKYNFFKLLRKLYPQGEYSGLRIDPAKVGEWESILYSHTDTISRIKNLRDKIYGHTDSSIPAKEDLEVGFTEIEDLLNDLKDIFFEVAEKAVGVTHSFKNINFQRRSFNMIRVLAEHGTQS